MNSEQNDRFREGSEHPLESTLHREAHLTSFALSGQILAHARQTMAGQWNRLAGVFAAVYAVTFLVQWIPVLGTIASILISGPIYVGLAFLSLQVLRGETWSWEAALEGFERMVPNILAYLTLIAVAILGVMGMVLIGVLFFAILGFSPSELAQLGEQDIRHWAQDEIGQPWSKWLLGAFLLLLLFAAVASYFAMRISFLFYVLAEPSLPSTFDAFQQAWKVSRGQFWILSFLSFRIGLWMLACIPTFGIGLLWVMPWLQVAWAHTYQLAKTREGEPVLSQGAHF